MMGPRPWDLASRLGAIALLGATAVTAYAAVGAWRVEAWPAPFAGEPAFELTGPSLPDSSATVRAVLIVTEKNPFRRERRRPSTRYRLPSERTTAAQLTARPTLRVPILVLLGIAHRPGQAGVAAVRVQGGDARLVTVGGVVEGFEVTSIEGQEVTFARADTTLVLTIEEPGAGAPSSRQRGRLP